MATGEEDLASIRMQQDQNAHPDYVSRTYINLGKEKVFLQIQGWEYEIEPGQKFVCSAFLPLRDLELVQERLEIFNPLKHSEIDKEVNFLPKTCEHCRFLCTTKERLECHRHSPVALHTEVCAWPFVNLTDFCGDWEKRE